MVLAPFRETAAYGVGASPDEDVRQKALDAGSIWLNRVINRKRPKGEELEQFYTEMEACIRTGLSEAQALRLVTPMAKTPYFRGVLSGLRYLSQTKGCSMSDAWAAFPETFDDVAVELKKAGETSGRISVVYKRLADRTAAGRKLQGKFKSALVAPGITVAALLAAMCAMHFKILPGMKASFEQIRIAGAQMPLPTKIVMTVSDFLHQNPAAYIVPAAITLLIAFKWRSIRSALWFQKMMVRLPFIGPAYRMMIMSRSLGALAMLQADNVPIEQCYAIAARVSAHPEYRDYFKAISQHIRAGTSQSKAFMSERWRIGLEGMDVASRMDVAAVTGQSAQSLDSCAVVMNEKADSRLDHLPKLISPVVTLISAAVIGLMVMAVFLPTFSMLISALKAGSK